jgi:beta-phosphoglucomutase-like phosphatase (HAD superfamily)
MQDIKVPDYVRALIFDCDGTLVDSMPLHLKAWEHVITAGGGAWDHEFFCSKKGTPERTMVTLYNRQFGFTLDPVETVRSKHEYFWLHAGELRPIVHVVAIARKHYGLLPMAVASGGTRKNVSLQLEALQIRDLFPVVLTADDDIRPKPAPDIFLEAARRLRIAPEYCQVFEDGDLGLEAARAAGMLATDVR